MAQKDWQTWVWVKWKPGTPATNWENWKNNSKVKGAWSTQGEWDSVFWLESTNPDEIEDFVWNDLRSNEWVEHTFTSLAKKWW